ncbi:MAG TPA: LytR C-terminal domain-containing protein [Candidatus Krumholzibacteria bacterium]|nr:LytR C-terminal domain-containing protein [Candidatus Krumholzibacteria bacterium]
MAAKKKRRARRRKGGGIGQRIAVALAAVVLVLCASSVTFSLFVRKSGDSSEPLRVVIRNGSGVAGVAGEAEKALREMGVVVVEVGNAERFDYGETILVVRRREVDVKGLAERIGCRKVTRQLRKDADADAEIILGADYSRLRLGVE